MFEQYETVSEKASASCPRRDPLHRRGIKLPLCRALATCPRHRRPPAPPPLQAYRILLRHTSCLQPLSCDEAFMDVTGKAPLSCLPREENRGFVQQRENTGLGGRVAEGRGRAGGLLHAGGWR